MKGCETVEYEIGQKVIVNCCDMKDATCTVHGARYEEGDGDLVYTLINDETGEMFLADPETMKLGSE